MQGELASWGCRCMALVYQTSGTQSTGFLRESLRKACFRSVVVTGKEKPTSEGVIHPRHRDS